MMEKKLRKGRVVAPTTDICSWALPIYRRGGLLSALGWLWGFLERFLGTYLLAGLGRLLYEFWLPGTLQASILESLEPCWAGFWIVSRNDTAWT